MRSSVPQRLRILVVDDSDINAMVLQKLLRIAGWIATSRKTGVKA
ncbi:hypothetical protein PAA8504_01148 [Palleronia abyssalis]|uniref:Response regulatory domain-containing protein n=1 Tax=Palleronia abyssalis TaxID=1501240 RepID=A0A2R8BT89_9RHOB|nr:hypothetical protein PAA8504_01148 [Palleronia abyssalis]